MCVCVITESASRVCENMVVIHKTVLGNVLKIYSGTSIEVQWLRLRTSTTGARVWSLVRELRSCMPCGQNKQTTTKPENPESNYTRKFLAPCRAAFLFYLKYLPHKNSEISHNCSDSQLLWKPKRSGQTKPIFLHGTYDQNAVTVAHLARMPIPVCWPLPGPCVHIVYQPGPWRHLSSQPRV